MKKILISAILCAPTILFAQTVTYSLQDLGAGNNQFSKASFSYIGGKVITPGQSEQAVVNDDTSVTCTKADGAKVKGHIQLVSTFITGHNWEFSDEFIGDNVTNVTSLQKYSAVDTWTHCSGGTCYNMQALPTGVTCSL